jgi:hypothetical protein
MARIDELVGEKLFEAVSRLIKESWFTPPQALRLMALISEHTIRIGGNDGVSQP